MLGMVVPGCSSVGESFLGMGEALGPIPRAGSKTRQNQTRVKESPALVEACEHWLVSGRPSGRPGSLSCLGREGSARPSCFLLSFALWALGESEAVSPGCHARCGRSPLSQPSVVKSQALLGGSPLCPEGQLQA